MMIPDHLPPSVARLKVVEINSRSATRRALPSQQPEPPALPAALDVELAVPGRVFVRGRGLDSEWGGQVKITGTSAAPQMRPCQNGPRVTAT
jgi:translocation and assembly module TamB